MNIEAVLERLVAPLRYVVTCWKCNGTGKITIGLIRRREVACHICGGDGEVRRVKGWVKIALFIIIIMAIFAQYVKISNGG